METFIGHIGAMTAEHAAPIRYSLAVGAEEVALNDWIGHDVGFASLHEIACTACGRITKKSFNNGYCYPCFKSLPENDLCIVKPHECHYDRGTCRDSAFGDRHCMTPHYVYLALSSEVKVGLTRKTNVPKRWIDQGAIRALPIAELPTRKMAGELEVALGEMLPDKTNWRKMLQGDVAPADLFAVLAAVRERVPALFRPFMLRETEQVELLYPLLERIGKLTSWSLDKQETASGRLIGIKGQYLLFADGVFHVRKHAGYKVEVTLRRLASGGE